MKHSVNILYISSFNFPSFSLSLSLSVFPFPSATHFVPFSQSLGECLSNSNKMSAQSSADVMCDQLCKSWYRTQVVCVFIASSISIQHQHHMHSFHFRIRRVKPCSPIRFILFLSLLFFCCFLDNICILREKWIMNRRTSFHHCTQHQYFKCLNWIYGKVWNSITDSIHSHTHTFSSFASFIHSVTRNQLRAKSGWHSHKFPFPFPFPVYHIYFFEMHYRVWTVFAEYTHTHTQTYVQFTICDMNLYYAFGWWCWFCMCMCVYSSLP